MIYEQLDTCAMIYEAMIKLIHESKKYDAPNPAMVINARDNKMVYFILWELQ